MSALTWMIFRGFTPTTAAGTLAAVGVASGLVLLALRSSHHRMNIKIDRTNVKIDRAARLIANMAGEVSALRDESECRWLLQDMWENHKETADVLFSPPDDAVRG